LPFRSRRAILASRNAHKARELEALLPGWTIEPLDEDGWPPETGATYEANARGKAEFGRAHSDEGAWTIGEDSGIEVDALDGRPGIESARYAPEGAPAIAKLLGELDGVPADRRGARYVSELVALSPDGEEVRGSGTLEGRIAGAPRGTEGFGYDPVFVPDGEERTVAELGDEWKTRNSHRARAAGALLKALAAAGAAVLLLAGCGGNDSEQREVLARFFLGGKAARQLSSLFPHAPGKIACVIPVGGPPPAKPLNGACATDVTLVKHGRAVVTLTETWEHGGLAHTWFFFIKRNGTIESVVQEGAPAPQAAR
jgi:XTP/dITP diphosphohydrolase